MGIDLLNHRLRNGALVERLHAPVGNGLKGAGQLRVLQHCANRQGLALLCEQVFGQGRRLCNEFVCHDLRVQSCRHRKTFTGQPNGGFKQFIPRQFAVLFMGHLQRPEHTGHPHRKPAYLSIGKGNRFAGCIQEHAFVGPCRCCFPTIKGLHLVSVPVHDESTAADAACLRLYQRQDGLHGNGGINRRPAFAQHLLACSGCQRVSRRSHMARGMHGHHIGPITRGDLGCGR